MNFAAIRKGAVGHGHGGQFGGGDSGPKSVSV